MNYRIWNKETKSWETKPISIRADGSLVIIQESCRVLEEGDYILQWSTGRMDITGLEVYEGDVIESHLGGRILALNRVVKQGSYQAYCPVDKQYMDNVGFYVSAKGLPDMPLGPAEDYAKVIGNILENPELTEL